MVIKTYAERKQWGIINIEVLKAYNKNLPTWHNPLGIMAALFSKSIYINCKLSFAATLSDR